MLLERPEATPRPAASFHPSPPPGLRVRGFLCGTTNPLLSQNTRLAEVIVQTLPSPEAFYGADAGGRLGAYDGRQYLAMGEIASEKDCSSSGSPADSGEPKSIEMGSRAVSRHGGVISKLLVS